MSTVSSTTTDSARPSSIVRRIAAVTLAAGLALGGVACSTSADDDEPKNPTDVNVESDDILPPSQGSDVEMDEDEVEGG
jgi:hypothetical protein